MFQHIINEWFCFGNFDYKYDDKMSINPLLKNMRNWYCSLNNDDIDFLTKTLSYLHWYVGFKQISTIRLFVTLVCFHPRIKAIRGLIK